MIFIELLRSASNIPTIAGYLRESQESLQYVNNLSKTSIFLHDDDESTDRTYLVTSTS